MAQDAGMGDGRRARRVVNNNVLIGTNENIRECVSAGRSINQQN